MDRILAINEYLHFLAQQLRLVPSLSKVLCSIPSNHLKWDLVCSCRWDLVSHLHQLRPGIPIWTRSTEPPKKGCPCLLQHCHGLNYAHFHSFCIDNFWFTFNLDRYLQDIPEIMMWNTCMSDDSKENRGSHQFHWYREM